VHCRRDTARRQGGVCRRNCQPPCFGLHYLLRAHADAVSRRPRWCSRSNAGAPGATQPLRPCRASTSLAPFYSPRARLPFGCGGQSPPPAPRQLAAPVDAPPPGGGLVLFPFASAIKCHQKSTCNCSAGSFVGSLAPPGHRPRLGWAVRPCRASTSLVPFYSPRARPCPSVGGQSPPPAPR
jgi:hypothetical protein